MFELGVEGIDESIEFFRNDYRGENISDRYFLFDQVCTEYFGARIVGDCIPISGEIFGSVD